MNKNEIENIKESLLPVFTRNRVRKVILFGSVARGTDTRKSDLDLMIIVETDKRFFDRYGDYDTVFDLIKNRHIEMLIYTPDELDRISHRPFIKSILREGLTIYEQ